jgi:HlyD family secretion protein
MNRLRIAVAVLVVGAVVVIAWLILGDTDRPGVIEASGTVEATEADLGFNLPGRIESIAAREGDSVVRGEVLARLEAAELEARQAAAEAQAEGARAILAELEAGSRSEEVAQARAGLRAAEQRLENAGRDLERARTLHGGGAISQEALDRAETQYEVAAAAVDQAREQLRALESGPRRERIAAQRAAVASADAAVRQATAQLDHAVIRAPFDGRITIRHREPGEAVQPGQPILTLMDPNDRWVRIYVAEDRTGAVRLDQPAVITSDTFEDEAYEGRVVFIAREAEFTPRNVQTREERVKLVYAVRVEITGDPDFVLKPGVPADVRLLASELASEDR